MKQRRPNFPTCSIYLLASYPNRFVGRRLGRLMALYGLLLLSQTTVGQSYRIYGKVYDTETETLLPFANVSLKGTDIGTTADFDGNFEFLTDTLPTDTLFCSAVGYIAKAYPITSLDTAIYAEFRLKPTAFSVDEVVIDAGENPAHPIVRGIIRYRDQNDRSGLGNYQASLYSKLEVDANDLPERWTTGKLLKPFSYAFENIDTVTEDKPYIPFYLNETIADVFYIKGAKEKVVPKARKVSGIKNESVVQFINTMHTDYNVYKNYVQLLGKNFVSPFAGTGLFTYEYYLYDSSYIDQRWCYYITFKPKRKQEYTFYGDFWVDAQNFAVVRLNMRVSPDANFNLVEQFTIYNEFTWSDSLWLPRKIKNIVSFEAIKNTPGLIGRRTWVYKDFLINQPDAVELYREADPERYDIQSLKKDTTFWEASRLEPLSGSERMIYAVADSIDRHPAFIRIRKAVTFLASGMFPIGNVEIGPYMNIFSSTPLEGNRLSLGIGTSNKFSKRVSLFGYAAYGFGDQQWKYGFRGQFNLRKRPRTIVGASYNKDIASTNLSSENFVSLSILSGFFRRDVPFKFVNVEEAKVFLENNALNGWTNRVTLLYRYLDPIGNTGNPRIGFDFSYVHDKDGSPDTTITSTEFIYKSRYAFREKVIEGNFSRRSLGTPFPILTFTYTAGLKGLLGSDYAYHKINLGLEHYFYVGPLGWIKYYVNAGKVFGTVPYLLAEVHPGNEGFAYIPTAFNLMNQYEFASDLYASIIVVHHMEGFFLNHIPLLRKLKIREVASFRAVWGTLSPNNRSANSLNFIDAGKTVTVGPPNIQPYMEVGLGLENIFKVLRFDVFWRLNYLDRPNAKRFTINATVSFNF